jgi:hypothetical protein
MLDRLPDWQLVVLTWIGTIVVGVVSSLAFTVAVELLAR